MLTYAKNCDRKRSAGRFGDGQIKGKAEMIESLLAVGAEWSPITRATASHRMSLRRSRRNSTACRSGTPATTRNRQRRTDLQPLPSDQSRRPTHCPVQRRHALPGC